MTESKLPQSAKRVIEQWRQEPDPDYSLPHFNDPAYLREWMKTLDVSQSKLADEAGVSQPFISGLLSGAENFSEKSRTKIWRTLNRLQLDKVERDAERQYAEAGFDSDPVASFNKTLLAFGCFKTPLELANEEKELLAKERDNAREELRLTKLLLDMNLVDRCCDLEIKLAEAYTQIADFHRLFALKGSAVAGDELQGRIEQRIKKPEGA
jgi:transcriptional regulator with XRE-family HTH domain